METRRILVIAGSDSSGGAGLEADQKVIASYGCYAMTATTALTAQNTQGVADVHHTPPAFVKKQIDLCIEDVGVDVVKIGMLASAETVAVVADALRRHEVRTVVVDPVMVSTSGHQLLPEVAVKTLREQLLPLTTILTPNLPEAQLLLKDAGAPSIEIKSVEDLVEIAKAVQRLGPSYVLLKGGHLPLSADGTIISASNSAAVQSQNRNQKVVDILYGPTDSSEPLILESDYIDSKNTHGTGCSLASAIASNLALGQSLPQAVKTSTQYISAAIRSAATWRLGQGRGPIHHFHSTYSLPFAPGGFLQYLRRHSAVAEHWAAYTQHSFGTALADATLPLANFQRFLQQDYVYLTHFARAYSVAGSKGTSLAEVGKAADQVKHVQREAALHVALCAEYGVGLAQLQAAEEALETTAYSRWLLDVGAREDRMGLLVAFAPCMLGYGVVAKSILQREGWGSESSRQTQKYWRWVSNYVCQEYEDALQEATGEIERLACRLSVSRVEELVAIFARATRLECAFWDMAMRPLDEHR